jgi:hypothetical protein
VRYVNRLVAALAVPCAAFVALAVASPSASATSAGAVTPVDPHVSATPIVSPVRGDVPPPGYHV